MAYNYLSLVNQVCTSLNEVPLTSANFASATGFHADIKNAVNFAIRDINQRAWEWPWNHINTTKVLTAGQVRYDAPTDLKSYHMNSFRINGSTSLSVDTTPLFVTDYEEYLEFNSDFEVFPSNYLGVPVGVFRAPDNKFGVFPPPRAAFTLAYEYSALPTDLVDYDDVPSLPVAFANVIYNGSMWFAYLFRGEEQRAALVEEKFKDQIKDMRSIYINRFEYVRSTARF